MLTLLAPILKNKNGDILSKNNYRPIALTTVCSKVIELYLVKKLEIYLYTSENQFAYKKRTFDRYVYLFTQGNYLALQK